MEELRADNDELRRQNAELEAKVSEGDKKKGPIEVSWIVGRCVFLFFLIVVFFFQEIQCFCLLMERVVCDVLGQFFDDLCRKFESFW